MGGDVGTLLNSERSRRPRKDVSGIMNQQAMRSAIKQSESMSLFYDGGQGQEAAPGQGFRESFAGALSVEQAHEVGIGEENESGI